MPRPASESDGKLPVQPALLPYLFHFRSDNGQVFILAPGRTYQLRLPGTLSRVAEQVLRRLNGQGTIPQVVEAVKADLPASQPEMVIALIQYLFERGMLMDGAAPVPEKLRGDALVRWKRNLSFFSGFESAELTRYNYQLALQEAKVALIGLGGLGSWIAYSLAMAGVGKVVGIDGDQVETSNLNRQILFRPGDVGRLKAEVAKETFAAIAPEMEFVGLSSWIRGEDDVAQVIAGCDIVVLTADQPMGLISRWTNRACFATRIPLLVSGMASRWTTIGPLYVPGLTGCWECADARERRRSKHYGEMFRTMAEHRAAEAPSLAPLCAQVGGQTAYETIKYLTGFARPATLGCALVTDTVTMRVRKQAVQKQIDCTVCHVLPEAMPRQATRLPEIPSHNLLSRLMAIFSGRDT